MSLLRKDKIGKKSTVNASAIDKIYQSRYKKLLNWKPSFTKLTIKPYFTPFSSVSVGYWTSKWWQGYILQNDILKFTCSKSKIEKSEQFVNYIQSYIN